MREEFERIRKWFLRGSFARQCMSSIPTHDRYQGLMPPGGYDMSIPDKGSQSFREKSDLPWVNSYSYL
jgi:hypothetical protein